MSLSRRLAALLVACCLTPAVPAQENELAVAPERAHREVVRALTESRSFLPVDFAIEAMRETPVGVHRRADLHVAQAGVSEGVAVLLLAERSYFPDGEMIDLADAAIDTLAAFFEALFELWAQRTWLVSPERRSELEAAAASLYVDLPAEHRLEALIDAQGQYAGHLLTIAATIERSARRGADVCGRFETPLFRLWERTASEIAYRGTIWIDDGWRTSRVDLPADQRAAVRQGPLAGWWAGRVADDFAARYCR